MSARLVIYTVLIGDKEPLGNPLAALESHDTDLDIDFICFTDNRKLCSDVWQFRYMESGHLPPEKLSRRPKALPHDYLREYGASLYIDNIVTFKRLPCAADLATKEPYLFRVYRHATRRHPGEEADAIVMIGYDDADTICRQLDFYTRLRPIESITPLSTCTVILRSHNHQDLIRFGITWWEQILNFSKRDQMSFDFAAIHTGCRIESLPGLKHDNDLIHNPINAQQGRVKASFDPVRYAWRHRHDPLAKQNPQAHFLAATVNGDAEYARRVSLFDYICHKRQSSLGSHVAPRRRVAEALQMAFESLRERGGTFLSIRVRDDASSEAFTDEEFSAAEAALSTYLFRHKGSMAEFATRDFCHGRGAFQPSELCFDIIVVLGLPPAGFSSIAEKLHALVNPDGGTLTVVATGRVAVAEAALQEQQLGLHLRAGCRVNIAHSAHDNLAQPIDNSVITFNWPA
jgi:hypothetical protein